MISVSIQHYFCQYYKIFRKDFFRAKKHQICYKKIFDDDIDFQDLEVEINSYKKNKNNNSIEESGDFESEEGEAKSQKKKKHDAMVIEDCPKIFRELRNLDEYNAEELNS